MPVRSDRTIPQRQRRDHIEWMQTHRFIEEVHRLEADGRVEGRSDLERRLLLPPSGVSIMRSGKVRVPTAAIQLLKQEYNGDFQYILMGVRDPETSGYLRAGRSLRVREGYVYPYPREESGPLEKARALVEEAGLPKLPGELKAERYPVWNADGTTVKGGAARTKQGLPRTPSAYEQLLSDLRAVVREEMQAIRAAE